MAKDIFTYKVRRDYIELYLLGQFVQNCDNWTEVEETKHKILGY